MRNSDPIKSIAAKTQTAWVLDYGGRLSSGFEVLSFSGDVEKGSPPSTASHHSTFRIDRFSESELGGGHLGHGRRNRFPCDVSWIGKNDSLFVHFH
ncbi:MAG: hypothetical protein DMG09_29740 [Acidobacteria bacterium]|nr:MAG: hypothetical protein DMG09_29740 [Acidobacteriota bacterium]